MTDLRFVVVKGQWTNIVGPKGHICVYALTDGSERMVFLESLVRFVA